MNSCASMSQALKTGLRRLKTDQMREGVFWALDIETPLAVKHWIELAGIVDGYLLRGIAGNSLNLAMGHGKISRMFKSIAIKAELVPQQISGLSKRTLAPLRTY